MNSFLRKPHKIIMEKDRRTILAREIARAAGMYITRESNRSSLITVTRANLSPDFSESTIFISVLPESEEQHALDFLKRNRSDFRDWIAKEVRFKRIPFFDFAVDFGEKNHQQIEKLI